MESKQIIAMWTSNILLRYADKKEIRKESFPAFTEEHGLAEFLIRNYELFHLYPDDAVLDEIDKEIARSENASRLKNMDYNNPALAKLLMANIIGILAAEYSDKHGRSLAYSLQHVIDSDLYQKLLDPKTALYCESIPLLYAQIA
jgi:hypothetical protein